MNSYEINHWKESADESWSQNEKSVKKNGVLYFFVTVEQKEYLEKHISEIDEWCEGSVGEETTAIRFEKDWDGMQECYTCECYFDNGGIEVISNVDTVAGLMDVYTKKGCDVKVGAKKYFNGDYSKNGSKIELYTIDSDWYLKFFTKISSKDGSEITDDIIKSHVQIFYDVIETK
jgi:hypothetical protein